MSRVGKQPIAIPSGVTIAVNGGVISVQGPKGKLEQKVLPFVDAKVENDQVVFTKKGNTKQAQANWGTTRSLVANRVTGVTEGWKRSLELQGVGFVAQLNGNVITLATGYSHKSDIVVPPIVSAQVDKQKIELESCDRQVVGELAATLRAVCPPEPYLGKGVRYAGEAVRRKAGKAGAK